MNMARKRMARGGLIWLAALLWPGLGLAAEPEFKPAPVPTSDKSFQLEIQHAIDRGLAWLKTNQNPEGWWSTADQPAVTSLALMAFQGEPTGRYRKPDADWKKKAYTYILASRKPDGSFQRSGLATYNTALCLMALLAADRTEYEPIIRQARQFLIGLQSDFNTQGEVDSPFDGGIGYGSSYEHSDMGNTLVALEALYYSRRLAEDKNLAGFKELNLEAAIHFLQSCQNLPAYNKESWASGDPKNKGGFVYYPGSSKAGTETVAATGRVAIRSYGSISYAGLLSYIYADLKPDDPRVKAVFDWLQKNYTLQENPGMGAQGLFFYFHTMSKALSLYGVDELKLENGKKIDWRRDLAMRLINLQKPDGSWLNDQQGRWWEKDPALVTSYTVLALERLYPGL
jgi:squalene-hopene/tetraprenyl-beta-curcumene cyclase